MSQIVFHVGPGKCGSSTIQRSLALAGEDITKSSWSSSIMKRARREFTYHHIDAAKIYPLNKAAYDTTALAPFESLFSAIATDVAVFSHEVLFQMPRAVGRLVELATNMGHTTTILGYSRRQDDFIRSSFCQWLFRDKVRLQETWDVVNTAGLDPHLFSALERHIVAAVLTDFETARVLHGDKIFNWNQHYGILEKSTKPFGTSFSVGYLPSARNPFSLSEDAFSRCGITIQPTLEQNKTNEQFSLYVIEAVAATCLSSEFEFDAHTENEMLAEMSKAFTAKTPAKEIIKDLNAYILGAFFSDNKEFCTRFSLDPSYFEPPYEIDRSTALKKIEEEQTRRRNFPSEQMVERERVLATMTQIAVQKFRSQKSK